VFILIPEFHRQTNIMVAVISSIAEVSMVVWLLIKGIKTDNETPIISKAQ
jgi:hypothetical protein